MPFPVTTSYDDKPYINRKAKSNSTASYFGYNGADVRGWSFASSKSVWLKDCVIKGVKAEWGACYGVDCHWSTTNIYLEGLTVDGIDAASSKDLDKWNSNPTTDPNSIGIRVASSASKVDIEGDMIDTGKAAKDAMKVSLMSDTVHVI